MNSFRITITAAEDNERLDRLLSREPRIGSRAAGQKLIAAGQVLVDGRRQSKNFRVHAGQAISVLLPPQADERLTPEPMDLHVSFEDDFLLVVDKPAGLVVHPAKGHQTGTLVHGLLSHRISGGYPGRPGIVHRLDKDTSGLLIVAKDEETHRRLARMMAAHEISRTYLALVHGRFQAGSGTVEASIARDIRNRKRMAVAPSRGRSAITHFKVLESWPETPGGRGGVQVGGIAPGTAGKEETGGFSLLEVTLETGRTHQIRVHLAAIGHPVAGDRVYGRRGGRDHGDPVGAGHQFLHSARLEFTHPVTGNAVKVSAPLPPDLQSTLNKLRQEPGAQ